MPVLVAGLLPIIAIRPRLYPFFSRLTVTYLPFHKPQLEYGLELHLLEYLRQACRARWEIERSAFSFFRRRHKCDQDTVRNIPISGSEDVRSIHF